jgi:hypothetical protein
LKLAGTIAFESLLAAAQKKTKKEPSVIWRSMPALVGGALEANP